MASPSVRGTHVRLAREQRVSDILDAARDVFTERGYDAATVAEVAARCGIVEGTVYKYFDTKRELLLRVLEHWYEELFGDYSRELAGIEGTRARVRHLVWRHLRTVRDSPMLARLMFMQVRSQPGYRGSALHTLNRRYTALLEATIAQAIAAGEVRDDVAPRTVRDLVYGGIEHLSWHTLAGRGRLDPDRTADELTRLLWHGLAAPAHGSVPSAGDPPQPVHRLARIADRLAAVAPREHGATSPDASASGGAASPTVSTRLSPRHRRP